MLALTISINEIDNKSASAVIKTQAVIPVKKPTAAPRGPKYFIIDEKRVAVANIAEMVSVSACPRVLINPVAKAKVTDTGNEEYIVAHNIKSIEKMAFGLIEKGREIASSPINKIASSITKQTVFSLVGAIFFSVFFKSSPTLINTG